MIIKKCQTCNKKFKVFPCRNCAKYCSRKCHIKIGEKNPKWRGGKRKGRKDGYISIYAPNHPYKSKHGKSVYEHRLVMEKYIGRYLKPEEIVHHLNGDASDNRIKNLELLAGQKEHAKLHYKFNPKNGRFIR